MNCTASSGGNTGQLGQVSLFVNAIYLFVSVRLTILSAEELLPDIVYSLDVWHAAKNLAKDLREASSRRETRPLAAWIGSLKNHFWYCSQQANGSKAHFMVSSTHYFCMN